MLTRCQVFIITGGTGGIGLELAQILYRKNGKVCITGRSSSVDKAAKIISEVKARYTASTGELWFLSLDLNDLTTIKTSAEQFLVRASRLDVLWNNAGVMIPPSGSKTTQVRSLQSLVLDFPNFQSIGSRTSTWRTLSWPLPFHSTPVPDFDQNGSDISTMYRSCYLVELSRHREIRPDGGVNFRYAWS